MGEWIECSRTAGWIVEDLYRRCAQFSYFSSPRDTSMYSIGSNAYGHVEVWPVGCKWVSSSSNVSIKIEFKTPFRRDFQFET